MKKGIRIIAYFIGFVILTMVLVQSCATSDLRSDLVKKDWQAQQQKGEKLLADAAAAYNVARWDSLETYSLLIHDKFQGFVGKNGNPYPGNEAEMLLTFIPNTFTGSAVFQKGKNEGLKWGIQNWKTYTQKGGENPEFKKNKDITFWLPTYQYFVELPFRLTKADVISYAGSSKMDGKEYDLVFVSWKKAAPQKDIDQYVVWINKENQRIEKVEYTVRDMYNFLTGTLHYKDFREVEGLTIPFYMPVESNMAKGYIHEMKILDFKVNTVTKSTLMPEEGAALMGDEK